MAALHEQRVLRVVAAVKEAAAQADGEGKLLRTDRSVHASHSVRNSDKRKCTQVRATLQQLALSSASSHCLPLSLAGADA